MASRSVATYYRAWSPPLWLGTTGRDLCSMRVFPCVHRIQGSSSSSPPPPRGAPSKLLKVPAHVSRAARLAGAGISASLCSSGPLVCMCQSGLDSQEPASLRRSAPCVVDFCALCSSWSVPSVLICCPPRWCQSCSGSQEPASPRLCARLVHLVVCVSRPRFTGASCISASPHLVRLCRSPPSHRCEELLQPPCCHRRHVACAVPCPTSSEIPATGLVERASRCAVPSVRLQACPPWTDKGARKLYRKFSVVGVSEWPVRPSIRPKCTW
jgi:hypothetical protein